MKDRTQLRIEFDNILDKNHFSGMIMRYTDFVLLLKALYELDVDNFLIDYQGADLIGFKFSTTLGKISKDLDEDEDKDEIVNEVIEYHQFQDASVGIFVYEGECEGISDMSFPNIQHQYLNSDTSAQEKLLALPMRTSDLALIVSKLELLGPFLINLQRAQNGLVFKFNRGESILYSIVQKSGAYEVLISYDGLLDLNADYLSESVLL